MLFTPDEPTAMPEKRETAVDTACAPEEVAPIKAPPAADKQPAESVPVKAPSAPRPVSPEPHVTTVPLIVTRPSAATTDAAAAASGTDSAATPAGGVEQELEQKNAESGQDRLPPGVNEYGEIDDLNAYDEWQAQEQTLRGMQRREEVNINHSRSEHDDIEVGGNF